MLRRGGSNEDRCGTKVVDEEEHGVSKSSGSVPRPPLTLAVRGASVDLWCAAVGLGAITTGPWNDLGGSNELEGSCSCGLDTTGRAMRDELASGGSSAVSGSESRWPVPPFDEDDDDDDEVGAWR